MIQVSIIGISRHRIGVDGQGITTLVGLAGCPLSCKYCINENILKEKSSHTLLTAQELYDVVKIDDLYFQATGGGITFGGGEPLLNYRFIKEFANICQGKWNINIETSLSVDNCNLQTCLPVINRLIIDVKDLSPSTYLNYTGHSNKMLLQNLKYLIDIGFSARTTFRVPLIKGFNTTFDVQHSIGILKEMGFNCFEEFEYVIP